MLRVIGLTTAAIAFVWAAPVRGAEHTKDTPDVVKKNQEEKKAVIVDVREQDEWDAGHLQGAILLPLSKLKKGVDAETLSKILPKDKIIYTYCRAGKRSLQAADLLKQKGYEIRALKEGFSALVEAGLPKAK